MALQPDYIKSLKSNLKNVKQKKAGVFFYCVAGKDGDPVLLVDKKRIGNAEIKAVRTTARKKKYVSGTISFNEQSKNLIFECTAKSNVFEKHIKTFFGKAVPPLKRAEFVYQASSATAETDDEVIAAEEFNANGIRKSSLDDNLAGVTVKSGGDLIAALEGLKLGEINFESNADENSAPGVFQNQIDDITAKLPSLEELLRCVQNERVMLAKQVATDSVLLSKKKRGGKDREEILRFEASQGKKQDQLKQLLAHENGIRDLIGVAHAQIQNGLLGKMEAESRQTEQRSYENLSPEDLQKVLEANEARAHSIKEKQAHIDSINSGIEKLNQEYKSELLRLENKEQVALQKLNDPQFEQRAQKRLALIAEKRQELASKCSTVSLQVDRMRAEYLLEQARSEQVTDHWSEETAQFWSDHQKLDDSHQYSTTLRALTESEKAFDQTQNTLTSAQRSVQEKQRELSENSREYTALQEAISTRKSENAALKDELKAVQTSLSKAGRITNTEGLKAQQKELTEKLKLHGIDTLEGQKATLEQQRQTLSRELERLTAEQKDAQGRNNETLQARNRALLSEQEQKLAAALELRKTAASDESNRCQAALEESKKQEADARAAAGQFSAAEDAFKKAREALYLAEQKHKQTKNVAEKWRGLRFKEGKKQIDEARAALPGATLELEAAQKAYADALKAYERQKSSGTDQQALIAKATEASKKRMDAEYQRVTAESLKTELELESVAQETRIAALSEDTYRQRRDAHRSLLLNDLKGQSSEIAAQLDQTKAEKKRASEALNIETGKLIKLEIALQQVKDRLAGQPTLEEMTQLLQQQEDLQVDLKKLKPAVEAAESTLKTATEAAKEARGALMSFARTQASGDGTASKRIQDIAQDLVRSQDALDSAKHRKGELVSANITAQDSDALQVQRHEDLARQGQLIDLQDNLLRRLTSPESREVIESFHSLSGKLDDKDAKSLDLFSKEDQQKLKKQMKADGKKKADYEKLMALHSELEMTAIQMIAKDATEDELERAFAGVPNSLRPPAYRAEIRRFDEIKTMLAQAELKREVEQGAEAAHQKKLTEESTRAMLKEKLRNLGESGSPKLEEINKQLQFVDSLIQNGVGVGEDGFKLGGFTANDVKAIQKAAQENNISIHGQDFKPGENTDVMGQDSSLLGDTHTIIGQASAVYESVKATASIIEYAQTDTTDMDPVERLLHEEKLQKILLDSTHAALKTVSEFSDAASLPAPFALFGMISKGIQLAESIVHTCARKANKTYDQALQRAAKVSGSVLAGAFLESVEREGLLYTKYKVKSLTTALGIAGDILSAFPTPATMVGAALGLASFVGNQIAESVVASVEMKQIRKAKEMLDRANAGDDVAKVELFKRHALYAKGLIAHMAQQQDGFAMAFVRSRGLSDQAVAASSREVVMHYLLHKAEQKEDDYNDSNLIPAWRKVVSAFKKGLNTLGGVFNRSWWELERAKLESTLSVFEAEAAMLAPTAQKANEMMQDLTQKIAQVEREGTKQRYTQKRENITLFLKEFDNVVQENTAQLREYLSLVVEQEDKRKRLSEKTEKTNKEEGILQRLDLTVPIMRRSIYNTIQTINSITA